MNTAGDIDSAAAPRSGSGREAAIWADLADLPDPEIPVLTLEDIAGLGPKRRQALLRHFGGLQAIKRAGIDDLARVKGISRQLAEDIYSTFHAD